MVLVPILVNKMLNNNNMDKVVKCNNDKCGKHFMHTKRDTKCPFCHTKYGKVEVLSESDSDTGSEKKVETKNKKLFVKTQK